MHLFYQTFERSKKILIATNLFFVRIDTNIKENTLNLKNKSTSKSSQFPIGTQEARIRNDRQAVFQVVRDLVQAQFARGDEELTKRLWQDVADRKIDLDRVINLMYTCSFHEDDEEMTNVDETYQKTGLVG